MTEAAAPICGEQLKTTTCKRFALWPGGRCPRHGYGAATIDAWITAARGEMRSDDATVMADKLEEDGAAGERVIKEIRAAVAACMRASVEGQAVSARAEQTAKSLRALGVAAMASDDLIFMHVDDAARIAEAMTTRETARSLSR